MRLLIRGLLFSPPINIVYRKNALIDYKLSTFAKSLTIHTGSGNLKPIRNSVLIPSFLIGVNSREVEI